MEERVVCQVEDDPEDQDLHARSVVHDLSLSQEEFDFVEQPSEDFFCPVTFELLLNPHQTTCCGHHLSEKAVGRLQREGKPCPMCKEPKLVTIPDKFFKRKARAVLIRCPHKTSDCEWVGEVGGAKQHMNACPKRPWKCQHCEFTSEFDVSIQHIELCTEYPVPCSNKCEIGTVPRCDVDKHRAECPLERVPCEFADSGCNVIVARRDLRRHLQESQQQHLLSATLLNLRLTRETLAEKDHHLAEMNRQIDEISKTLAEKEHQLAERDHKLIESEHQLAEKDRQIAEKDFLLVEKAQNLTVKERRLAEKDHQIVERDHQLSEKDKLIAKKDSQLLELQQGLIQLQLDFMESTRIGLDVILGLTCHRFTLEKFSECQKNGVQGDWVGEPFYSHSGGCKLYLNAKTKQCGEYMKVYLCLSGDSYPQAARQKTYVVALQLLNQKNSCSHYLRQYKASFKECHYTDPYDYITFEELHKRGEAVQYLKDDCLKFVLWIKEDA